MSIQSEGNRDENGEYESLNGAQWRESWECMADGNMQSVIEWLNFMIPHLNLPLEASEDELRACLIDGTVLCTILNKLHPGLVEMRENSEPGPSNIQKFLAAMDEIGLPRFVLADMQQGYMFPVLQCIAILKAHFDYNGGNESIDHTQSDGSTYEKNSTMYEEERQRHSIHGKYQRGFHGSAISEPTALMYDAGNKISEVFLEKQASVDPSDASILELMKSNSFDNSSTQMLLRLMNMIIDESIDRKNGHVHHMAPIMKKILQIFERRVSIQAENLRNQNDLYKVRNEKFQSRLRVLETLATGTTEEIEVLLSKLQQIKIEKSKLEKKEKLEEQELLRLKEEKNYSDIENLSLKQEMEMVKRKHEEHCSLLKVQAEETKVVLEKKLKELECFLTESRKKVKELELFSESKLARWKKKEHNYRRFIDYQFRALKELRAASESIKHDILTTKKSYFEEFNFLGVKLKGLADAAKNYHSVLAENRRLYNEVQDLKGNIRVYCRIRPFLPGQCQKRTAIEYIGENGEVIISNPSKQGKDSHRLFRFNKVFGPTAGQEEVFLDTQPLIRSVLDGYNVCIFAYGQTGSGKTYTMSGPNLSSKEDWGVNYRALHDLFQISQSRKSSITYEVAVQMVEIYNEQVRDLLTSDGYQKKLGIWSKTQPNGLVVPEANMYAVTSTSDVLELMNIGLMNRAVGATALNERSSRSHSILTVHVRGMDLETGTVLRGSLHLVDLAGSERVDRSEATGDRLREAQHINKSLSALGDVIFALAQKSSHVPYRNSKLTQVLQSSLGGQAKTLMFVQLNPDVESYSETISTLKFAERVSGVELGAARTNKDGRDIRELMDQVTSLKDIVAKKDEEIERLQQLKSNVNGMKLKINTPRCELSCPRRYSIRSPRLSPKHAGEKGSTVFKKSASEMDNCSERSEKRSEAGSPQSLEDFRHQKGLLPYSKSMVELLPQKESLPHIGIDFSQNSKDDTDLLGFGDIDSEERLSDISDGGLSMGTETDASVGSAVEFTLFAESTKPIDDGKLSKSMNSDEAAKPAETAKSIRTAKLYEAASSAGPAKRAQKGENIEKPSFVSKLPKPPQKLVQTRLSRLSLATSSTPKVSSSMSAPRKTTTRSFSATRTSKMCH